MGTCGAAEHLGVTLRTLYSFIEHCVTPETVGGCTGHIM